MDTLGSLSDDVPINANSRGGDLDSVWSKAIGLMGGKWAWGLHERFYYEHGEHGMVPKEAKTFERIGIASANYLAPELCHKFIKGRVVDKYLERVPVHIATACLERDFSDRGYFDIIVDLSFAHDLVAKVAPDLLKRQYDEMLKKITDVFKAKWRNG